MTDHPDLEALSAVLDGEPEPAHVQVCGLCRGRLGELRLARDAVAAPVVPLPAEVRDQTIARALAAADAEPAATFEPRRPASTFEPAAVEPAPLPTRGRRTWWLGGSAAAAAIAVVVGAVALVGSVGGSKSENTASFGADTATQEAAGPAPAASVVDAGDLGDVASVEALRARVPASRSAATSAPAAPGAGGALAATADSSAAVPTARQVGTRVCEVEARTARPQLGVVVYAANLRFQGTPAVVLGFAATPSAPPEILLVLAPQQGCRILAELPS